MARFFRRGRTKVFNVPTIAAATLIPTAAEVNAGANITPDIQDISGFEFQNSLISVPDLSTTFTKTIPGEDTAQEPQLVFYEDTTTNTLQTTFAKGTETHLALFFAGTAGASPAAADKAEVWGVISTGPYRMYSMGNDAAMWGVRFGASKVPNFSATLT